MDDKVLNQDISCRCKYIYSFVYLLRAKRALVIYFYFIFQPRDVQDSTPLHLAATYGHSEVAKLLLDNGANPLVPDGDKRTPLHEACLEGNHELARLLLEDGKKRYKDDLSKKASRDFA